MTSHAIELFAEGWSEDQIVQNENQLFVPLKIWNTIFDDLTEMLNEMPGLADKVKIYSATFGAPSGPIKGKTLQFTNNALLNGLLFLIRFNDIKVVKATTVPLDTMFKDKKEDKKTVDVDVDKVKTMDKFDIKKQRDNILDQMNKETDPTKIEQLKTRLQDLKSSLIKTIMKQASEPSYNYINNNGKFTPTCSCGWKGKETDKSISANVQWLYHRKNSHKPKEKKSAYDPNNMEYQMFIEPKTDNVVSKEATSLEELKKKLKLLDDDIRDSTVGEHSPYRKQMTDQYMKLEKQIKELEKNKQSSLKQAASPLILEQWISDMGFDRDQLNDGPEEANMHRKHIPANFVAIDSENSDDNLDNMWNMLSDFFGSKVYSPNGMEIITLERDGIKAFCSGDMTFTVFIDPKDLQKLTEIYKGKDLTSSKKIATDLSIANRKWNAQPVFDIDNGTNKLIGYNIYDDTNRRIMTINTEKEMNKSILEQVVFDEINKRGMAHASLTEDIGNVKKGTLVKLANINTSVKEANFISFDGIGKVSLDKINFQLKKVANVVPHEDHSDDVLSIMENGEQALVHCKITNDVKWISIDRSTNDVEQPMATPEAYPVEATKGSKCINCGKLETLEEMVKNEHGAGYLCKKCAVEWNKESSKKLSKKDIPDKRKEALAQLEKECPDCYKKFVTFEAERKKNSAYIQNIGVSEFSVNVVLEENDYPQEILSLLTQAFHTSGQVTAQNDFITVRIWAKNEDEAKQKVSNVIKQHLTSNLKLVVKKAEDTLSTIQDQVTKIRTRIQTVQDRLKSQAKLKLNIKANKIEKFWVVTVPTPVSTLADIVFESTPHDIGNMFRGGLEDSQIVSFFDNNEEAIKYGEALLKNKKRYTASKKVSEEVCAVCKGLDHQGEECPLEALSPEEREKKLMHIANSDINQDGTPIMEDGKHPIENQAVEELIKWINMDIDLLEGIYKDKPEVVQHLEDIETELEEIEKKIGVTITEEKPAEKESEQYGSFKCQDCGLLFSSGSEADQHHVNKNHVVYMQKGEEVEKEADSKNYPNSLMYKGYAIRLDNAGSFPIEVRLNGKPVNEFLFLEDAKLWIDHHLEEDVEKESSTRTPKPTNPPPAQMQWAYDEVSGSWFLVSTK